ncbi:MAG TPA: hypothetical protein DCE41_02670 [Cytophagales bacterium]|nr:hypothetical protein [Cytophagales bacterium]HAA23899.1 hypothetical protein [Cytophagales bacterium]
MIPGEEMVEAFLSDESGEGPYRFDWTFEDGAMFEGRTAYLICYELGAKTVTLRVSNAGGSDEMTHNVRVVDTGTLTFYTNSQPIGASLWRLRVNGVVEGIGYRILGRNQPECGSTAQPDR